MREKTSTTACSPVRGGPRWWLLRTIYQMLLPVLLGLALPGWLVRMIRRGGLGSGLHERFGHYTAELWTEPCAAVHVHAVSVGEAMLAMRLIRAWRQRDPSARFVLAVGTATGHAVARTSAGEGVRVTYVPFDLPWMVHRYLTRFEPSKVVLVEGEMWPNLLAGCRRRGIPVSLVNARMSPRSARRYRRFASWLRPLFSQLSCVAIQEESHRPAWTDLGVSDHRITCTGSLKFDPEGAHTPTRRDEFADILRHFGDGPVLIAVSTFPGEESFIATAMHTACPTARIVIAPRHAERAEDAATDLLRAGFLPVRRTSDLSEVSSPTSRQALLIDTTGELRDWIAHANVAVIGKSFLSQGGQNPTEAILADVPVIFGRQMGNFEPLATGLVQSGGALQANSPESLAAAIREALVPARATALARGARRALASHHGATHRILDLVSGLAPGLRDLPLPDQYAPEAHSLGR